jgi:uncharacterized caspase-like protein
MSATWITPPYRALLVGINQYEAPSTLVPNLYGCVADAEAFFTFLLQDVGMSEGNILFLKSPSTEATHRATRANIIAGLRDFLGKAPSGSEVFFYYSGHGSYTGLVPEIQFGKMQGETLVPADARVNGVPDIIDREMRVLRAELAQKEIRLTAIIDSCFSGDVMRGEPAPVRNMAPRMVSQAHGGPRTLDSLLGGTVTQAQLKALYAEDDRTLYTLLSGCLATQQSYEVAIGSETRGVMTTALLTALQTAGGPLTYTELNDLVMAFISPAALSKQQPTITGDVDQGVFGTPVPARTNDLFAAQAVTPTTIELRAGLIAGIEVGSLLQGYSDWSLKTALGTGRVTSVTAHRATAEVLNHETPPQVGQPFELISRSNRPKIYFHPTAAPIQAAWSDDRLVGSPALVLCPSETLADYVVAQAQGNYIARYAGAVHPELCFSITNDRSPYDMARKLNRVARYESFVSRAPTDQARWNLPDLNHPGGVFLTAEHLDGSGNTVPLTGPLPPRPRFRFTLRNETGSNLWLAVYLLDEPFFVAELLYPDSDHNFYLAPDTQGQATWGYGSKNTTEWSGGLLDLKVIVSSQELTKRTMPRFPCGTRDTFRGMYDIDEMGGDGVGQWTTYRVQYG